MRNSYGVALVLTLTVSLMMAVGCGPGQQVKPSNAIECIEPVCFQGTVQYRLPGESTLLPFANVKVTAWRHEETKKAFSEAMADAAGKYCLQVPLGDHGVDIRVWGMVNLGNKSYTCTASEDDIKLGKNTKKCGEECATIDLITECREFRPSRRLGK